MKKFFFTLLPFVFCGILFAQPSCLPGGIGFANQAEVDAFATNYPGCTCIEGDIDIFGKNITSLAGLSQITRVKGDLSVSYLSAPDFIGFDNLNRVDGHLFLFGNMNRSTTGFESLNYVGAFLNIFYNGFENLEGFQNLATVGAGLFVRENANLVSLDGLNNISYLTTAIWLIDNGLLSDISSLNNIFRNIGIKSVRIKKNPNLQVCNVTPICALLNRGSTAQIENNAEGCNSQEELCCTFASLTEDVFIYSDTDMLVDGTRPAPALLTVPVLPGDANCSDIVMEGYFRVVGASCESDIEVEITDPSGNPIFMGNVFSTCNGSGSSHPVGNLYYVSLPIPTALSVEPGNWTVQFTDSNDQNTGVEYLMGFVSLTASCEYSICEDDVENKTEDGFVLKEAVLYPIPTNQRLNIDYYAESTRPVAYEIFSAEGKTILYGEHFVVRGKNTFQVDVTSLSAGHYYMRMSDDQFTQTKPFVKVN